MTFEDYQKQAIKTAIYPKVEGKGWVYPALGLTSEAGEVAGKLKKVLRDNGGELSPETRDVVAAELGDVLWYVSQLATELDLSLAELAQANLDKLASRAERTTLTGSGDRAELVGISS